MEEEQIKKGFFRRVWYSITKIEKYPVMAAEGVPKAFSYFSRIILIFAIIVSLGMLYQTYKLIQEGTEYVKTQFPEFSYTENTLTLENESHSIIQDSSIGKIIVDTNDKTDEEINVYKNSIENNNGGIIVLKDKVIIKNIAVSGEMSYNYSDLSEQIGVQEFNKQDVINYINSSNMIKLYLSLFGTLLIYSFVIYYISVLSNVAIISVFGYIASWIAKIKMRYAAIFNMSVYAMTLSVLLEIIYIVINIFVNFTITYFQVAYIAIACIYVIAAIFIIKSEFIKKQAELTKIVEVQKQVKENEEEPDEKKTEDENKEDKQKKKEPKEKKEDKKPEEPEGSEA